MIIYKVTNKDNGKCYIGQTVKDLHTRIIEHIGSTKSNGKTYFNSALRKYGIDNFSWEVIRICDSIKSLNVWEQYYILYYNSFGKDGYNLTSGGEGYIVSKKTKKKMSDVHKDTHHSEETKEKMRKKRLEWYKNHPEFNKGKNNPMYGSNRSGKNAPCYGKSCSEKTRKKIGVKNKLWYKNHPNAKKGKNNGMYGVRLCGEKNGMYNKHPTEETRAKMRISQRKRQEREKKLRG